MILIHVSKKWTGVSQRSHVTRRKVLKEGTAYTVGFCVYWTVLGILYSSLILSNQQFEPNRSRTRAIVWMLALRGSWDLLLWLHASSLLRTLLKPGGWHLARTQQEDSGLTEVVMGLRRDWMLFTSGGIIQQAKVS